MKHCFDKKQIEKFIDYLIKDKCDDKNIVSIIENSKDWKEQIFILNFLVSQIIQKKIKKGQLPKEIINRLYSITDYWNIKIEEIDIEFVDFIYTHKSISSKMNENLIFFKEKQINYDYRNQICN
jgi:hypothetical protein